MERPHTFKTTKLIAKELKGSTPEEPKYETKRITVSFDCDLDDIRFVDVAFKNDGDVYKAKCTITHTIKGDIVVNSPKEVITELIKNKYKTSYVRIKGFGK